MATDWEANLRNKNFQAENVFLDPLADWVNFKLSSQLRNHL